MKAIEAEHHPYILAVKEVIPTNYRIPVQKAEIKISDDYDVFPDCISTKGRGIMIQIHRSLNAQEAKLS